MRRGWSAAIARVDSALKRKGDATQYGDPVQFIDARDLAEWTIHVAEQHITDV